MLTTSLNYSRIATSAGYVLLVRRHLELQKPGPADIVKPEQLKPLPIVYAPLWLHACGSHHSPAYDGTSKLV